MKLLEIIERYEDTLRRMPAGDQHRHPLEVIMTLAKEIQLIKDYVRKNEEDLYPPTPGREVKDE